MSFLFPTPTIIFFSLGAGLANQIKPRISQKISPGMCPPPQCTKKEQIISLLGHYLFTLQIIIVANVEGDQHLSTIILLWPLFGEERPLFGSFFTVSTYIILYHVLSSFLWWSFWAEEFFFIRGEEKLVEVLS